MRNGFIDICRGVAILGVIFHHYYHMSILKNLETSGGGISNLLPAIFNHGWLGVNLFFILSGLILYRPGETPNLASTGHYYLARARRLLPLYFVIVAFMTLGVGRGGTMFMEASLLLLTGVHNLVPSWWMPKQVLWVCWSLGIEILFSILLPLVLLVIARTGFWRVFFTVMVFCFVYRVVGDQVWFAWYPGEENRLINPLKDNIFGRLDDFLVGMAAAQIAYERRKLPETFMLPAAAFLIMIGACWTVVCFSPRSLGISVTASALYSLFSLSVLALIVGLRERSWWGRIEWQPLAFMGTICYSAYFVHAVIYHEFKVMADRPANVADFGLYLLATVAISTVLFVFLESSGIRSLPRWAGVILGRKTDMPAANPVASASTINPMLEPRPA